MEKNDFTRFRGMLGFAMRAGKVLIGTDRVISALPDRGEKAVRLVLIANDASEATKKKLAFKCEFYGKEIIVAPLSGEELGKLLGKLYVPAVAAITDDRFADELKKSI
ncbi:MAG: ribosomal L7Ae/L30e/S12e/Gadd45 family protein [Clostridia bacterium]|nr:ribosomal L7Ae/L30e/S12e/Gadd45 family protein [Clostridia bacterium]